MDSLGFYFDDSYLLNEDSSSYEDVYRDVQNVLNGLGWVPFLGTIVGVVRLSGTTVLLVHDANSDEHTSFYVLSITRGIVELFSLGFLFIIPDIIATIKRKRKIRKIKKQLKKIGLYDGVKRERKLSIKKRKIFR